jgi:hypothetical protein
MVKELSAAKTEVDRWSEWKKSAMRREVMNVSSGSTVLLKKDNTAGVVAQDAQRRKAE